MNSGQACRPCRGSCSPIFGRGCFGDLPGDGIVVSVPSPMVKPLGTPKRPSGRLLCETYHAGLTNQCLTASGMCTVSDSSPRSSALHHLSSSTTQRKDQVILTMDSTVTLYRVQYNVGCNQTRDRKPKYSYRNCSHELYHQSRRWPKT